MMPPSTATRSACPASEVITPRPRTVAPMSTFEPAVFASLGSYRGRSKMRSLQVSELSERSDTRGVSGRDRVLGVVAKYLINDEFQRTRGVRAREGGVGSSDSSDSSDNRAVMPALDPPATHPSPSARIHVISSTAWAIISSTLASWRCLPATARAASRAVIVSPACAVSEASDRPRSAERRLDRGRRRRAPWRRAVGASRPLGAGVLELVLRGGVRVEHPRRTASEVSRIIPASCQSSTVDARAGRRGWRAAPPIGPGLVAVRVERIEDELAACDLRAARARISVCTSASTVISRRRRIVAGTS